MRPARMTIGSLGRARFAPVMAGLALASAICAAAACAQVMEIGDGGEVKVYDRPYVFDAEGATAIERRTVGRVRKGGATTFAMSSSTAPVADAADAAALSPDLVAAVAWRESRFRPGVVSRAGAIGEMQLMPGTARALGVDPRNTAQNYRGGATYLGDLMRRYDGDLVRTLAAYNAGPGVVDRYGGLPPYKETRAYVAAILDRLSRQALASGEQGSERHDR
jgi:soluble lytic murein transglycosylase-like protein